MSRASGEFILCKKDLKGEEIMKTKPKVKPTCAGIARSAILLLTVVLLSSDGVSRGGVEPCDPNIPPMPFIEPGIIPPIDPGIKPPIDPGIKPPIDPGIILPIEPFPVLRQPANCAIIGTSPRMLIWPSVATASSYNVYLGTNQLFTESDLLGEGVSQTWLVVQQELRPSTTYYWRVDVITSDGVWHEGNPWIFHVASPAEDPNPANGEVGVNLPLLQWTPDTNAAYQNVYLGTSPDLTEANLVAQQQEAFYFIPLDEQLGPTGEGGVQPNMTYYWRVDEVLEDGSYVEGDVWSFRTKAETPSFVYAKPVAWWTFDENAGPVAKDTVGSRDGDIVGASWYLLDPPRISTSAALDFDGEYDWVEVNDVSGLFDESFSISCWVNGGDAGQVIFSQQGGVNWLMVSDSLGLKTELTEPALSSNEFTLSPGEWYNFCVTWDSQIGEATLYLNGIYLSSQFVNGPPPISLESPIYIGCGSNQSEASFWNGVIDEVRIFDRALTEADLDTLTRRDANIVTDKYYTGLTTSKHVRIDLNNDKALAAVISEDATDEQIAEFANSLGLGVVKIDRPNRIVGLELPYAISRLQAAEFTRAARKLLDGSPFVEIGLAVTPGAAETSILVNEQFTVQLAPNASIDEFIEDGRARIVRQNPFNPNEYLLEVTAESEKDAMELANEYHDNSNTMYAVPNLAIVPEFRGQALPPQWHLDNEDNDADIDAYKAWGITRGDGVVIAVIDTPVDDEHPDLSDSDNIVEYEANDLPRSHGTAVAGCIGAHGIVSGSCPNSSLVFILCNITTFDQHQAFYRAEFLGADVICCSWGYKTEIETPSDVKDAIFNAATFGRIRNVNGERRALGCVILFAMTNEPNDNGGFFPDISSLERVIAVSGSTDQDKSSGTGYGNIMEVLAPTSGGQRRITTTDVRYAEGYNNQDNDPGVGCADMDDLDYTRCFGGTSAACATTAGVAGLILSADPNLYRRDVQRLLQDTADKIDDSAGRYNSDDGFSVGLEGISTHGYGRINAYEAVSVAARGVDIFMRDNRLDFGNTEKPSSTLFGDSESFIPYWQSPDIEVHGNSVIVRVRNRGPVEANSVTVRLYACFIGQQEPPSEPPFLELPDLPEGFWDAFPDGDFGNDSEWLPWGESRQIDQVPYSAGSRHNLAGTVNFDIPDSVQRGYYCLLAMAQCYDDKVRDKWKTENLFKVNEITPNDNNVTQLYVQIYGP